MNISKLRDVPIRDIWDHEPKFSDWLKEPKNLKEIGDQIGLTLVDPEREKPVGAYRCDIVCKDETTNKIIIIENQLESTNHDHLGKIVTYASSLNASVVVWIVKEAKEEHSKAIEWLNEHIDSEISFFLIELHIVKIDDSKPAINYKVIVKPNDFSDAVKTQNKSQRDNKLGGKRYEFWTQFNEVLEERGLPFNKRKPSINHWYTFSIGSSICHLAMDLMNKDNFIRVKIDIPDSKEQFDTFFEHKEEIEKNLGVKLDWDRKDNKKASWISYEIQGLDFAHTNNYEELMNKSIDMLIKMRDVFKKYLM